MEEDVRICPECGAEYFPHVTACRSCEAALVSPAELEKMKESPAPMGPLDPDDGLACLEEGTLERITEIHASLTRHGIDSRVLKMPSPDKGCSDNGGYGVFIPRSFARMAVEAVRQEMLKLYPEVRQSEERLEAGLCPACGAELQGSPRECPDCGLSLTGECGDDDSCGGGCGGH